MCSAAGICVSHGCQFSVVLMVEHRAWQSQGVAESCRPAITLEPAMQGLRSLTSEGLSAGTARRVLVYGHCSAGTARVAFFCPLCADGFGQIVFRAGDSSGVIRRLMDQMVP